MLELRIKIFFYLHKVATDLLTVEATSYPDWSQDIKFTISQGRSSCGRQSAMPSSEIGGVECKRTSVFPRP